MRVVKSMWQMFKQNYSSPCRAWEQMETPIPCAQMFKVIRKTHKVTQYVSSFTLPICLHNDLEARFRLRIHEVLQVLC